MKKHFALLLGAFLFQISASFAQKTITVEDVWQKYAFYPKSVSGFNFLKDGSSYVQQDGQNLNIYSIVDGQQKAVMLDAAKVEGMQKYEGYSLSDDEQKILFETESEQLYRHSTKANFYVYDRKSGELRALSTRGKQQYPAFSPNGTKVAFCRDNNIFYADLETGAEIQVTTDGKANEIINGSTDWVYEEEFSFTTAFQWSPDGKRIAYMRFDESKVPQFAMEYFNNELYPTPYVFKYPKAGEQNSSVQVFIYELGNKQKTSVDLGNDPEQYIPRMQWTKNPSQLCITRLNRHQNNLDLLLADASSGKTRVMLNETNKYYIDIHDHLTFLEDGQHFIWTSELDGYNHIYMYDLSGKLIQQITSGKWDVTKFYGVDEANKLVYYQAAEKHPTEREVYVVNLDGKKKKCLSKERGENSAEFSKTYDYFVLNHSSVAVPPSYKVMNRDGKETRVLEDNSALSKKFAEYQLNVPEFFDFKTSDNVELNGWMIKPSNFDPKKKYPVFMYVYGGPGSQTVENNWDSFMRMWFQLLAQKGYIVVSVDNRGTGARGQEFKKSTYLQLGKYETIDQIEAAKYLAGKSFVDAKRIGIFGWSYGGYMSSLCLFKGAEIFKMAIAVAPVTNWKWYDTIYTERFMRTPKENPSGYEDNSPVNFADRLKGKYLLIHGMTDDNVHFQNTAEMANALIMKNKQFDTYFYPNSNHGIGYGVKRVHLFTKMTDFVLENL